MGLLDEAIREHLELKRRSGGDPSEIAREEHEALAPVFGEAAGEPPDESHPGEPVEDLHAGEPARSADFADVGQETAELDMQTVLGSEEMLTEEHAAPSPQEGAREQDFDWQSSGSAGERPVEPGPDQERLSFE